MTSNEIITIFTPTFNREKTLERCYQSLLKQNDYNFIWLVIDDGSTDNTASLITNFREAAPFAVNYIYQENAGKQAAWNKALDICTTEYFICLDSDDALIENALAKVMPYLNEIKNDADIAGLRCNAINSLTNTVDSGYLSPKPIKESWFEEVVNDKFVGEKLDVFKTDVLRQFYFPIAKNIKFIPENWMYCSIAKAGFRFLYLPAAIRIFYHYNDENRLTLSPVVKHAEGHYICRSHLLKIMPKSVWIRNPLFYLKTLIRFAQTARITQKTFSMRRVDTGSFLVAVLSFILQYIKAGLYSAKIVRGNMPIYVLNLEHNTERKKYMQDILKNIPVPYSFFPAVYGKEIKNIDDVYDSKKTLKILNRVLNEGEIGCALSHRLIYKKMIDENISQALILEDDVSLSPEFYSVYRALSEMPIGNKIVLLGTTVAKRIKKVWRKNLTSAHSMYLVLNNYPGTYGYVIGLEAAKKIYYHNEKGFIEADRWKYYRRFSQIWLVSPSVVIADELFPSEIGSYLRHIPR
ncbi:glycosyltransferase family 25 protein [Treponema denticola]|uniref:glycosyltransferase family 25 protein n=1 Tax=Treponema denticola TaxID=158 RepID=UPI002105D7AB|nr:glycosyltransferase family 25 protein [Treponema denticola]UTY25871.1 glycosyltransferase [Treponema denticola]